MSTVIKIAEGGEAEIDGLRLDLCDNTCAHAFVRLSTHEARRIAAALQHAANEFERAEVRRDNLSTPGLRESVRVRVRASGLLGEVTNFEMREFPTVWEVYHEDPAIRDGRWRWYRASELEVVE